MDMDIYNYTTVKFLPYPETGEFVNIGVVAFRPRDGRLQWQYETRRSKRVTDFFPELDKNLLADFTHGLEREFRLISTMFETEGTALMSFERQHRMAIFKQLVRPREGMMRFGELATGRFEGTEREVIGRLFDHYVRRNFAQHREYREHVMNRRLKQTFAKAGIGKKFNDDKIGNELFQVSFPFVYRDDMTAVIKPLDLKKADTTRIFEHGGQWVNRLDRLERMDLLPDKLLFAVDQNPDGKTAQAAKEICKELEGFGNTHVVALDHRQEIILFARTA